MASTRGEERRKEKKKQSATRKPGDAPLRSRNVSRYLSARWNVSSASSSMPCWHDIQSTRSWRIAALSSFERVKNSGEKTKSGQFCVFGVFDAVRARRADGKSLRREIFACRCGADTGGGDGGGGRAGARDGDLRGDRDRPLGKSMRQRASRGGARVGSRRTRRRRGRGRAERARRARKRRALETVCAPEQVPVLDVGGEGVSPLVGAPSAARGERVDVLRGANLLGGG